MNRSRYVPHPAYSISPYQTQAYGAIHPASQLQGVMPGQPLVMPTSTFGSPQAGMGQSPVQSSLSPNAMWATNFANGPIIEDLCAPPPPIPTMGMLPTAHPMAGLPPHMAMPPIHPGAMPQVQNVFGIRQPTPLPPFAAAGAPQPLPPQALHHPGQGGAAMQGVSTARVMGSYPPYAGPQLPGQVANFHQHQVHQQQQAQARPAFDHSAANPVLHRPRLETVFPSPPVAATPRGGNGGAGAGQGGSPDLGSSPGGDGMPSLTPEEEEAWRGFLNSELGELGDLRDLRDLGQS